MKKIIFSLLLLCPLLGLGQVIKKQGLDLPKVPGYLLLKGDFHLHTVYSDGPTWPTYSVEEAYQQGLDVLVLTDHLEKQRWFQRDLKVQEVDLNQPYEYALETAKSHGIIFGRGLEVTKDPLTAGHYCVLFAKDLNAFKKTFDPANPKDGATAITALEEARRQGALTTWNHPWDKLKSGSEWTHFQDEMMAKGVLDGITICSNKYYELKLLDWCLDKNLTVFSVTDEHEVWTLGPGEYRPQTILFAKERSEKGVKDAIVNRLTVAYHEGYFYGREDLVRQIFENSIEVNLIPGSDLNAYLEIKNKTNIVWKLNVVDKKGLSLSTPSPLSRKEIVLDANATIALKINKSEKSKGKTYKPVFSVENTYVRSDKHLLWTLPVSL